jgi:two-component system LytT family response regulator
VKVRALIVEDEPLPRRALRALVEEVDWLDLVGEAADGRQAVERIDALHPDLVFLDVHMPELSGIEVLNRVEHQPAVVFTTAFDRYAVAAFELEAIDYLIKPFGRKRFHATLERVRRRLADAAPPPQPLPGERARAALEGDSLQRVFAHKGNRIVPLQVVDVARFSACDDYTEVHCRGETFLLPLSLQALERRLDPARFVRVHRSHVVNLDHVRLMRPFDERRLEIELADGSKVVASRAGSQKLRELGA